MRKLAALAALLAPSLVLAESTGPTQPTGPAPTPSTTEVVGGTDAPAGKWPDAAAIIIGGSPSCTGTLISPTIVLTAGHCNIGIDSILVGTNSLSRAADGETIAVAQTTELQAADVTVLQLATPSRFAPRAIATGWARFDIKNDAPVAIVGYGATDRNASQFTNDLQEATSIITDFDCSVKPGCLPNELGAGGNGIDSCNGDSGGPLYLLTDYGEFLIGVTSRAYDDAMDPCGEGGIYGRPDLLVDDIERIGGKVSHGPEPTAERIEVLRNSGAETVITANDPKAETHTFEVATPPQHGTAVVRGDGRVRVCMDVDAPTGDLADVVVINVTDKNDPSRSVPATVVIAVGTEDPGEGCDVNAFEEGEDDGGGCCDSGGRAGGAAPLALIVLLALRRRRR